MRFGVKKSGPPTPATKSPELTLRRRCPCGTHTPGGATCKACAVKGAGRGRPVMPKLTVNQPGDRFEQEADRIADAVMRTAPVGVRTPETPSTANPHTLRRQQTNTQEPGTQAEEEQEQTSSGGLCFRTPFPPGVVIFTGFTPEQLGGFAVISEEAGVVETPVNGRQYAADGFWVRGQPCTTWFKVPSHCTSEITPAGGGFDAKSCCNWAATLLKGWPRWSRDTHAARNPFCPAPAAEGTLQRAAVGSGPEVAPPSVHEVLGSPGEPLDTATRGFFEPRFGRDLSHVRVHTNDSAAASAADVSARAYTVGSHIVFGRGEGPNRDPRLMAHELAHVEQHEAGGLRREVDQAALDQCVAEQGGSTWYRDGGVASPEELDRYRRECIARQTPTADAGLARAVENLGRAWEYAKHEMEPAFQREVAHLFTRESLVMMAAFAALFAASQLTPVGWVADALALTVISLSVIFVGALAISVVRDLGTFFSAVSATTEEEFEASGKALARATARGGVGLVIALLTRGLRGAAGPPPPGAPATVQAVAAGPGGLRMAVTVTAPTAARAVEASRLQALASYAVMVPPPGGTEPSAPSGSSGGGSGGRQTEPSRPRPPAEPATGGLTRVEYGAGPLSQLAQRLRILLGLRRGGNVAVFEFENVPPQFRALVERLGGRSALLDGNRLAVQNTSGSAHSEQFAHMLITAGRRAGFELNVTRIYSEYNPCFARCSPLIQSNYPRAEISFSFTWESAYGNQTPARNAAVEALFGNQ